MKRARNFIPFFVLLAVICVCLSGCSSVTLIIDVYNQSSVTVEVKYKEDNRILEVGESTTFESTQLIGIDMRAEIELKFRKLDGGQWKSNFLYSSGEFRIYNGILE